MSGRPEIVFNGAMLKHVNLKRTQTVVKNTSSNLVSEKQNSDFNEREYFFNAGIDVWYSQLKAFTFPSMTVQLTKLEANLIVKHWKSCNSVNAAAQMKSYPRKELSDLQDRIQACMDSMQKENGGRFFVKLSSRSPKDSHVAFEQATTAYRTRIRELECAAAATGDSAVDDNTRWLILSEEVGKATSVQDATAAMLLLCSSERIAEDLIFALDGEEEKEGVKEVEEQHTASVTTAAASAAHSTSPVRSPWDKHVNIVVRTWDPRITLQSEFRGFCWDYELNCIGQYYHPLYFEELQSAEVQEEIKRDCMQCFNSLKQQILSNNGGVGGGLPVPNAMIDFAWLGRGKGVLLIEINPLSDVLGSFPASTGLFDWVQDRDLIQGIVRGPCASTSDGSQASAADSRRGKQPFELRVRTEREKALNFKIKSRPEWRELVYGRPQQGQGGSGGSL